jgi:phage-related minor tail protein
MPADLIIRTVDRATAALRGISARIRALFEPLRRLRASFRALANEAGLDRIGAGFGRVGKSLGRVGAEAKKLFGGVAKYAGVATLALSAFVVSQSEAGDALGKSAARVDLTVDAYAQLSSAAEDAGIEQQEFTSALDSFNKSVGEAKLGKGKLAAFLKSVSPSLLGGLKGAKDTEGALNVMFKALDRLEDPGKRAALATKAFGGSGAVMTQLIAEGLPALVAARKAYERTFGSQEAFVAGASALDDELDTLKRTMSGLARGVATQLFPAFGTLARQFSKFLLDNKDQILQWAKIFGEKLLKFAQDLPGHLQRLGQQFDAIKAKLQPLAERVGGFANLLGLLAGAIIAGPLLAALASLTSAFITLGVAILTTPVGWVIGAIALIAGAAFLIKKNWGPITDFFRGLWDDVRGIFQGFMDWVTGIFTLDPDKFLGGIKKVFGSLGDLLPKLWKLRPMGIAQATIRAVRGAPDERGNPSGTGTALMRPSIVAQRPAVGAERARPKGASDVVTQNASVTVQFKNTPPGTQIRPGRENTAPLTLQNVGRVPELG